MLRWRLLSAAIILAALSGLFWLDHAWNWDRPGVWLAPLVLALAALAVAEMLDLFAAAKHFPSAPAAYLGTLAVVAASCAPVLWTIYPADCPLGKLGWPLAALALGVMLAFAFEMRRYREPGRAILNVSLGVFIMAYVGFSLSFFAALRLFGGSDSAKGLAALLSLAIVVKSADTGAYAFGRAFGRHKLCPLLSPGKTVEGAIGGLATACLASWLSFSYLFPWLFATGNAGPPWWACLAYGLVLAVAGMIGDLSESLIKRDAGRKDSSRWLPGLGGVLDVLDSLLLAAPPAYLCWVAELVW